MVVAYELFLASRTGVSDSDRELAPAEDLEQFHLHLRETLTAIGFLEQDRPERMMATLRQIFGRARLDSRDVAVLRGILTAVDRTSSKKH